MNRTLLSNNQITEGKRWKLPLYAIWMAVIFACMLLTGFVSQPLLSVVVLGASVLLIGSKKIYLVFPPMLFYFAFFGSVAGMSTYRWFTFIFLFITLLESKSIVVKRQQLLPFFLFALYCILVVVPDNLQRAVFAVLDMACILILLNQYLTTQENIRSFFSVYVLTALSAFLSGTQRGSMEIETYVEGELINLERNTATFEDPNYMGFFYTIAVFALIALRLFDPRVRTVLVVVLYAMMFASLSISAIVMNAALWLIYLIVTHKINVKSLIVILVVLALLFGLYQYGLKDPDAPVLGDLSFRIAEKLNEAEQGNYNEVTTNRTGLAEYHWEYFLDQPFHRMLIGMNAASVLKTDLDGFTSAAHNEYVDLLLNVGLVGAVCLLWFFLRNLLAVYRSYRDEGDEQALCMFMCKLVWMGYALSLTMYGDFRFWLWFFI